jgi:hypothetical protein
MENKSENSGMKKFSRENVPVVFMFQPTQYKEVEGEKLQQWEKDLIEKVGLKGAEIERMAIRNPTYCKCDPYDPMFDDCDQL